RHRRRARGSGRTPSITHVPDVRRQRDGGKDTADGHHHHHFDQRECGCTKRAHSRLRFSSDRTHQSLLISRQETRSHCGLRVFNGETFDPPVPPATNKLRRRLGSVGMPLPRSTEPTGTLLPPLVIVSSPGRSKYEPPALVPV